MNEEKILSEEAKRKLAEEAGFMDTLAEKGWAGVKTRDVGNMIKKAVEIAETKLMEEQEKTK